MGGKNFLFYLGMAAGVLLTCLAMWLFMPKAGGNAVPMPGDGTRRTVQATPVDTEALRRFFQAAEQGDFARMRTLGETLFKPGSEYPGDAGALAPFAVNSFPPYTVYAFLTDNTATTTRRVLLTIDDQNRVESFLAEEMAVVQ